MSGASKKKEKRSRSSSNEANTSFVQNVTSRMSGFLPATLTKWFNIRSPSRTNGSVPTADASDSSTEDEAAETPVIVQPPAKRMRLNPPTSNLQLGPMESTSISNIEAMEPYTPSQTPETMDFSGDFVEGNRWMKKEMSSERSGGSTPSFKNQRTTTMSLGSVMKKRKSLFDSLSRSDASTSKTWGKSNPTLEQGSSESRPHFKPCLLGSPFYSGRTTYGGAASSYINQPNIKHQKPTIVNETSKSDNAISHSALRVLDLLEQYSSPLAEARRIPAVQPDYSRESFLKRLRDMSPPQRNKTSYKTKELHVPSIASILRLKKGSRLMNTTNLARQIIASHSSTSDSTQYITNVVSPKENKTSDESSQTYVTKIKSRLTRQNRGGDVEQEVAEQLHLPSATLQIDQSKLANVSFGIPLTSSVQRTSSSQKFNITSTSTSTSNTVTNKPFQFSSPLKVSSPIDVSGNMSPPGFTFGSPERSIEQSKKENRDATDTPSNHVVKPTETITPIKPKGWQCADCWVSNKDDAQRCICCGAKKPVKKVVQTNTNANNEFASPAKCKGWQCADCWVKNNDEANKCVCCGNKSAKETIKKSKCTVCKLADSKPNCDLCAQCEKVKLNNYNSFPVDSGKWKCDDCWLNNEASASKCVCCNATNPKNKSPQTAAFPTASNTGDWKCNDCWIKNKPSDTKCAACGATKPGSKPTNAFTNTHSATTMQDESIKILVAAQKSKWECASCLVSNDNDKIKCACCESAKPGSVKETEKKSFNFDFKTNTTFKFGIDPKVQETKLSEPPTNKQVNDKIEEQSETNNNVVPKTPSFSFGIPPIPVSKPETDTAPKLISFDPPSYSKTSTPFPNFGLKTLTNPAATEAKDTEKTELAAAKIPELPKVPEPAKIPTNLFGIPPATTVPKEEKSAPTLGFSPQVSGGMFGQESQLFSFSNETQKSALSVPSETVTTSTPAPVLAPTMISTTASFTLPAPTTFNFQKSATAAPALSLFKQPEATTTTSLFQQTSAAPTITAPAPAFNFGASAPAPAVNSDKPKFNFSFGKQPEQAEPSSMFQFGIQNGAPANTNSFSLQPGNGLANATTASPFGSGSALGNALGSNSLTMNPSANTTLTGNGLPGSNMQGRLDTSSSLFSAPKDSMWPINNNASEGMFGAAATKAAPFTFGSSTFGSPNAAPAPTFGAHNSTLPTFDTSATPAQAPAFNFGAHTPSSGGFGFGQAGAAPVYAFGSMPPGAGSAAPGGALQFSLGSAGAPAGRRVRKAARRMPPR